jgi:hypothetical protein
LIQALYGCTRANRCLSFQEGCSLYPTPSPNSLTSLQNSLSLPSFPPHYFLLSLPIILTVLLGIGLGQLPLLNGLEPKRYR